MGNYEQLIAAIEQVIKTNGNNEITGAILQSTLKSIVNSVGANAAFAGIATPETNPGTPDQNVFYLVASGDYPNFGLNVLEEETAIFYNSQGSWRKSVLGFASQLYVQNIYDNVQNGLLQSFNIENQFIKTSGVFGTDSSRPYFLRTEYVYIKGSKGIKVVEGFQNPYVASVAFYDKNKKFISAIVNPDGGTNDKSYNATILSDDYPENAVYAVGTGDNRKKRRLFMVMLSNTELKEDIDNNATLIGENSNVIGKKNADLSAVNISGFINVINGTTRPNDKWCHGIVPLPDGATQIEFDNLPEEQYSQNVVNYFVDSDGVGIPETEFRGNTILGAGLVVKDIPLGAKGMLLNAGTNNLPNYGIYYYTDGSILSRLKNLEEDNALVNDSEKDADLSAVNISGFINVINGTTRPNDKWCHGIVPLPDGATQIEFDNLPEEQYSQNVVNYFVDSDGVGIPETEFRGNTILGAGLVVKDIPLGAKGMLLNAGTNNLPNYGISILISGVYNYTDKRIKERQNPIKLICPDVFYAVVGEEFNLYYDGIVNSMDAGLQSPKNIYIDIQCPDLQNASNRVGVRRERMWQITASKLTEQYIGEHDIQITAYGEHGEMIDRKIVKLKIVSNAPLSSQKYILCIGDSLTNNGPIVSTCGNHFQSIGGTQPIFIGQRITDGYKHEGYPGYTFGSFVTNASNYAYRIFDVPTGTNVSVNDKYATNGSEYTIKDIRTEGLDNKLRLRCERSSGSTEPNPTGTLTKVSGSSSSEQSIEYSAYEKESGNPFWDLETNRVDFTKYREKMGMGSNKFDIVFIMLGTNDSIGNEKQMDGSLNNAKTLINAILEDAGSYPTKILLQMVPANANTISSWQIYSDILGSGQKIGYWKNYWSLRKLLYDEFTKPEWENKVILGQAPLGIDRYYGYPYSEIVSSQRIQINEIYHTNSVHPNTDGYEQLGDGYYLQAKANL